MTANNTGHYIMMLVFALTADVFGKFSHSYLKIIECRLIMLHSCLNEEGSTVLTAVVMKSSVF
jgi:hypothetical protein